LDVPFLRPAALAADDTASIDVVLHALEELAVAGEVYDAVCLLQPTNPLRTAGLIDRCVERLVAEQADTVMTVLSVPAEHHPWWVYLEADDGTLRLANGDEQPLPRRQLLPPAFHREGSVYLTRTEVVMSRRSFYGDRVVGELVDAAESVNIDTFADLARAEALLAGRAAGAPD
ncbi:MAG: acylneuraminate cytidylyltransferase family protein, partial [Acidimicrobiales bacterium]|nr:acylneuraminate cytidylyltransferase family protein [Acidimicrobiales bacterium]